MLTFVGNQGNNAYRLCKWLRELDFEVRLFCFPKPNERSDPKSIDRDFEYENSDWVSLLDINDPKQIDEIKTTSDAVVISGSNGIAVTDKFEGTAFLTHFSLGSEVTELPVMQFRSDCPEAMRTRSEKALKALQMVDLIITSFRPTLKTLARLELLNKTQICGYPEDVEGNADRVDRELLADLNVRYGGHKRVFLWLSRLSYLEKNLSSYKGPEKFLNAFQRIVSKYGNDVIVVLGEHGPDVEPFKELIRERGLELSIEFVPHMPYWKLLTYLSISNAVLVDELDEDKGELSGIARELLSIGGVCIKSVDAPLIQVGHGDRCPILHAVDEESCFEQMQYTIELPDEQFADLQKQGREWAMHALDYHAKAKRYVEIIREARYKKSVKTALALQSD